MEVASQIIEIEGDPMRLVSQRGGFDQTGVFREPPDDRYLRRIAKQIEIDRTVG